MFGRRHWIIVGCTFGLAACAGLAQLQQPVSQFDQAVRATSAAQSNFYAAYEVSECDAAESQAIFQRATGQTTSFDIGAPCPATPAITKQQIATRTDLMSALVLYADKMQAVASGDNTQLDTNAEKLANEINGFAKSNGLSNLGIAQIVETAIIAVTDFVLDKVRYDSVRMAADAQSNNLKAIVSALSDEDQALGNNFAGNIGSIANNLQIVTNALAQRDRGRKAMNPDLYLRLYAARQILNRYYTFQRSIESTVSVGPSAAAGSGAATPSAGTTAFAGPPLGSPPPPAINPAQPLIKALAGIPNANDAIKSVGPGGVLSAVQTLYQNAQTAAAIYAAISESK